ncbi:MAG: hypothetical protein LC737_07585 [Chloroflexi bacterium]|nr:hypothetical protein [Chloroflexota bacterium]
MRKSHHDPFWISLTNTLENTSHYAGLIFALVSALTFAQGSRLASYIFLLVAYIFVCAFVMRWLARRDATRNIVLAVTSVVTFTWLGYNVVQDVRALQGIVVTPARTGETLILLAEFDKRGARGIDFTTRIHDRLSDELQRAKLRDVRIETVEASKARAGDRTTARLLGARHNAAFVVWGWYDDIDIHPDFVVVPSNSLVQQAPRLSEFAATGVDAAFQIREGLPDEVSYVTLFVMGQLLIRAERLDDARQALDTAEENARAAQVTDGLGSLYFDRAIILHLLGSDLNLVVDEYSRAISADPTLAAAFYNRSVVRTARGDSAEQVFDDYARAVELEPRLVPFAHFGTRDLPPPLPRSAALEKVRSGLRAYDLGDNDQALQDFTDALTADESYAPTYYFRARAHHTRREFMRAIDDYTRFVERGANYPSTYAAYAYYARALAYRSSNMPAQANADFDAYLRTASPDDPFRADAELYKQK